MIDLTLYSGATPTAEAERFMSELDEAGFDVLTSTDGRSKADGTRNAVCVWWGDSYVGLLNLNQVSRSSHVLGYRFIEPEGATRAECPSECVEDKGAFKNAFALAHGCPLGDMQVIGPEGPNSYCYLQILTFETALCLLKESAAALDAINGPRSETSNANEIKRDVEAINRRVSSPAERKRLVDARLGQGNFRDELLEDFNGQCAVTALTVKSALIASHIVAWKDPSTNDKERLDRANGLLLCATIDALFDRHLIFFDEHGKAHCSDLLTAEQREQLGQMDLVVRPTGRRVAFLRRHRAVFERKEEERLAALSKLRGRRMAA